MFHTLEHSVLRRDTRGFLFVIFFSNNDEYISSC